jgi:hypothetical protein
MTKSFVQNYLHYQTLCCAISGLVLSLEIVLVK